MLALADDSDADVTALGGRAGVRSARFAHEHATGAKHDAALLAELEMWTITRRAFAACSRS